MTSNSEAESHPYAMLDRCQSRRVSSVPIGDNLQILMARKTEAPPYEDLINFPRAKDKDEIRCVMCGFPPGMSCAIPRQNKDVCKECDKSTWIHSVSNVYFKWCKGCKKFLRLGSFSEKLDAAKCDRCRERGRQSYLLKKGKDGSTNNRSRSNSINSMKSDFETDLSDDLMSVAAAMASSRSHRGIVSQSEISSEEGDFRDLNGSDNEYDYPSPCGSGDGHDDLNSGVNRTQDDRMGDYNDTLMSAHAVVSLASKFHEGSSDHHEPVLIDDTGDVTKSKLSSVFGKPLCELKRMSVIPSHISDSDGNHDTDDKVGNKGEKVRYDDSKKSITQKSDGRGSDGVSTSLRGTLYELACIHERIMTLEEHASRVKHLEATIQEQQTLIETLRSDSDKLRQQLNDGGNKQSIPSSSVEQTEQSVVTEQQETVNNTENNIVSDMMQKEKEQEELPSNHKRDVASDLAMILDDTVALEALMERVQKRPRLVSMGE